MSTAAVSATKHAEVSEALPRQIDRRQAKRLDAQAHKAWATALEEKHRLEADIASDLELRHGPAYCYTEIYRFRVKDESAERHLEDLAAKEVADYLFANCGKSVEEPVCSAFQGDITAAHLSRNGPMHRFDCRSHNGVSSGSSGETRS